MCVKCCRDGELPDGRMKFLLCKNFVELALPFRKTAFCGFAAKSAISRDIASIYMICSNTAEMGVCQNFSGTYVASHCTYEGTASLCSRKFLTSVYGRFLYDAFKHDSRKNDLPHAVFA